MAVNCCFVPSGILVLAGVIKMDTSVAGVTVSIVDADTFPDDAVIVVDPGANDAAWPREPAALLTDATATFDELQVADAVRSCVEPSEKVPVAVNCCAVLDAIFALAGVIETDTSVAGVTVSAVDPDTPPDAAVMIVAPAAEEVTRPLEPAALLTTATAEADEVQAAAAVRSRVVPSE